MSVSGEAIADGFGGDTKSSRFGLAAEPVISIGCCNALAVCGACDTATGVAGGGGPFRCCGRGLNCAVSGGGI